MELYQVRYFLAVYDVGNFTRAADRCNVSQPALTQAIRKLEDELGSPLFHREHSRTLPTRLGELLYPRLRQMQNEAEFALMDADSFQRFRKVPLNLGVMVTIGARRLVRLFQAFRAKNPKVEVAVHEGSLDELLGRLDKGDLEIAILNGLDRLGDRLHTDELYTEAYKVLLPPGHRLAKKDGIGLDDLAGEAYVDRLSCELRDTVMEICESRKVELYATYRSEREDWIQAMVRSGLGFAFMPEYSITQDGLCVRPLVDPPVARTISLVSVPGRKFSPAAAAFARMARSHDWRAEAPTELDAETV